MNGKTACYLGHLDHSLAARMLGRWPVGGSLGVGRRRFRIKPLIAPPNFKRQTLCHPSARPQSGRVIEVDSDVINVGLPLA